MRPSRGREKTTQTVRFILLFFGGMNSKLNANYPGSVAAVRKGSLAENIMCPLVMTPRASSRRNQHPPFCGRGAAAPAAGRPHLYVVCDWRREPAGISVRGDKLRGTRLDYQHSPRHSPPPHPPTTPSPLYLQRPARDGHTQTGSDGQLTGSSPGQRPPDLLVLWCCPLAALASITLCQHPTRPCLYIYKGNLDRNILIYI